MRSFDQNIIMFELKKYRGVMFEGTEDWKLPGYSLFPSKQNKQRMVNTLQMIDINSTCRR